VTDGPAATGRLTLIATAIGAALVGAIAGGAAMRANPPAAPAAASALAVATCTGGLAETPDTEFAIPLDHCDAAIDVMTPKAGFLSKWTICGGAKSFDVSLDPREVKVTSDAFHCSSSRSEVTVTYIGPLKK
jgi:hypothetical protein